MYLPIPKGDRMILRELGKKKAECAADTANEQNIKLWTAVNDLRMIRPPVFIDEVPWHEMDVDSELTLLCESELGRQIECALRRELYAFHHFPVNMVVSASIECPFVVHDTGFGIAEDTELARTDATSDIVSRHFNIQIRSMEDVEKIKDPIITLDSAASYALLTAYAEVFEPEIPVVQTGFKGMWFTPWDFLIRLTGVEEAMLSLYDEPDYIESLVGRFVDASLVRLKRYSELNLWASNNNNTRVGSGGYGFTSSLPSSGGLSTGAPLKALWGCGNAQIFSCVSPEMHWEYSLKHEMRWLSHFGLTYYGCCEPLSGKMDILKRIPNLRKISMSPWADLSEAAGHAGGQYVLSCKPNPAIFASKTLNMGEARQQIDGIMKQTKGQPVEIVMKDISTVSYVPQNLWKWAEFVSMYLQ